MGTPIDDKLVVAICSRRNFALLVLSRCGTDSSYGMGSFTSFALPYYDELHRVLESLTAVVLCRVGSCAVDTTHSGGHKPENLWAQWPRPNGVSVPRSRHKVGHESENWEAHLSRALTCDGVVVVCSWSSGALLVVCPCCHRLLSCLGCRPLSESTRMKNTAARCARGCAHCLGG